MLFFLLWWVSGHWRWKYQGISGPIFPPDLYSVHWVQWRSKGAWPLQAGLKLGPMVVSRVTVANSSDDASIPNHHAFSGCLLFPRIIESSCSCYSWRNVTVRLNNCVSSGLCKQWMPPLSHGQISAGCPGSNFVRRLPWSCSCITPNLTRIFLCYLPLSFF